MKKAIGIGLLILLCAFALLNVIDGMYAYKEVEQKGYLIGVIDEMCINCDTNEEFYALVYEEGSIKGMCEEDTLLVSVNVENENTSKNFFQEDRIYVEFDKYKISLNGKEIIIEKPTVINTVIPEEKENL